MALGFRNLYLVGLGLYLLSFLALPRSKGVEPAGAPPSESMARGLAARS